MSDLQRSSQLASVCLCELNWLPLLTPRLPWMNLLKVSALSHLLWCLSGFPAAYCMQLTGLCRGAKNTGTGTEQMPVELLPPLLLTLLPNDARQT